MIHNNMISTPAQTIPDKTEELLANEEAAESAFPGGGHIPPEGAGSELGVLMDAGLQL